MCVTEFFVDRYPDGSESHFRQTRLCQFGHPGQPCIRHQTLTNIPREINYGEPTSEFLVGQEHLITPSSPSELFDEQFEIDENCFPAHRRKPRNDFLLNAIFGDRPRRRRRESRPGYVVVIDQPPSPYTPPRSPQAPHYRENIFHPSTPMTPPHRSDFLSPCDRGQPVIVDHRRRTEAPTSFEVNIPRQQRRSESPTSSDLHREDEEKEANRRRERDRRADRLATELEEARVQREREQRRARLDEEIRARPAIPAVKHMMRSSPIIDQNEPLRGFTTRRDISYTDMIEERRHATSRTSAEREQQEEMTRFAATGRRGAQDEARQERLRRRFTVGNSTSGRARHRVAYDSGEFRYHD